MDLIERSIRLAHEWTEASRAYPAPRSATLLSQVLEHEDGLDYTVSFVDGVIRPEDPAVAAENLAAMSSRNSSFLPAYLSGPAKVGGKVAPAIPGLASAAAQKVFAALVGDLVIDVTPNKLGPAIAKLREDGSRLNLNLLGEAVLGDEEAARRISATEELIRREDVDYVSLKVSAVIGPHSPFGYDAAVEHAVSELLPVFRLAKRENTFVNLDMEEYKDLHMTIDVFTRLLEHEDLRDFRAGIVLQAYLPDARGALRRLTEWAKKRRAAGGAPIKVRVVKGANLSMERVDAIMHGWELTVQPSKEATDANYLTILNEALTPENIDAVGIGIAGQNLFTLAYGVLLCRERGLTIGQGVDVEMLSGMATPQAHAVRDDVGPLLYYVPVVRPEEFDVAIAYLVRRLEENAADENFMSNVFDLPYSSDVFELEADRFRAAAKRAEAGDLDFGPRRTQDRLAGVKIGESFANTPDTDPSLPANIQWARDIASRIEESTLGTATADAHVARSTEELDELMDKAREAGRRWADKSGAERADILAGAAQIFADHRGDLIEVAASETGKTIDQADVEVSEAIDFIRYYSERARELDELTGATYEPVELTLITPPWNFAIAIPTGGAVAALATGSAVAFKPAGLARRTGALIAELLWQAGIPEDLLVLLNLDEAGLDEEKNLGRHLVERVDQVILTGSIDTARRFKSWRPELRLFAETSGKNAIIVTPQADIDLAVRDVVASAFGHSGQKCSAASLVILVGSVGFSRRFHDQLLDAVRSLQIGYPADLRTEMGPIIAPAEGKLARGLTTLEPGQGWAIKPKQLGEKLWSPGVRTNVQPGSEYHLTEYFGPILGVMRADDLPIAIAWQNATEFGLTAGIHSLDPAEIDLWLNTIEAGNVYVNRTITGAIVRRQPFGGWKRSAVGAGTKAGGPNYLLSLGRTRPDFTGEVPQPLEISDGVLREARAVGRTMTVIDQAKLDEVLAGMDKALKEEFCVDHDPSDLGVELNVLRYIGFPQVIIRYGGGRPLGELIATAAGAITLGAGLEVSTALPLPRQVGDFLATAGVTVRIEDEEQFHEYAARLKDSVDGVRIRLLGEDPVALANATGGSVDIAIYADEVSPCGRVELLPYVIEQAVSATNHRFGNHTTLLDGIL